MSPAWSYAVAIGFLGVLGFAHAQPQVSVERLWTGIYAVERPRLVDDPKTGFAERSIARDPKVEVETIRIPASIGTRFGIGFVFRGETGASIQYRVIWRYPPGGVTDPRRRITLQEEVYDEIGDADEPRFEGRVFHYDWELVPGRYVVEVWVRTRRLLQQEFHVFLP